MRGAKLDRATEEGIRRDRGGPGSRLEGSLLPLVLEVDGLSPQIMLEAVLPVVSADTAFLPAGMVTVDTLAGAAVDVQLADLEVPDGAHDFVHVVREEIAGEAVAAVVRVAKPL